MNSVQEFFTGYKESQVIFDAVSASAADLDPLILQVTKSQIALYHHRAFAWAWIPGRYLRGRVAPLVLSVALRRRDASPRWKEIVEPAPGRFMHHLELYSADEVDAEVIEWLREAWIDAASGEQLLNETRR